MVAHEPDRIHDDDAPADASPNALLAYIAQQDRKQTQALKFLAAALNKQGSTQRGMHETHTYIAEYTEQQQRAWHRMRQYIGCMFWLWIGLPILLAVLAFVAGRGPPSVGSQYKVKGLF